MKSDYEQREANRIARYEELAEKNAKVAEHQAKRIGTTTGNAGNQSQTD